MEFEGHTIGYQVTLFQGLRVIMQERKSANTRLVAEPEPPEPQAQPPGFPHVQHLFADTRLRKDGHAPLQLTASSLVSVDKDDAVCSRVVGLDPEWMQDGDTVRLYLTVGGKCVVQVAIMPSTGPTGRPVHLAAEVGSSSELLTIFRSGPAKYEAQFKVRDMIDVREPPSLELSIQTGPHPQTAQTLPATLLNPIN